MQLKKHKIDFSILDSLRGLASLYVCIAHCRGVLWMGFTRYLQLHPISSFAPADYVLLAGMSLTKLSGEFVIFFFILSGFSIYHSLLSNNSIISFFKKRFWRLYPPYLAGLVYAGIVAFLFVRFGNGYFNSSQMQHSLAARIGLANNYFSPSVILKNLFYMPQQNGFVHPYWSLAYEVIFYISSVLIIRKVNAYLILSVLLYIIGLTNMGTIGASYLISEYIFQYNFYFAIGIALYLKFEHIKLYYAKLTSRLCFFITIVLFALMILQVTIAGGENKLSFILASVLSVHMICWMLYYNVHVALLKFIGEFSYTLYLTHFASIYLVIYFLMKYNLVSLPEITNPFIWILTVPICIGIAYLMYLMVEKPTKLWLQKWRLK